MLKHLKQKSKHRTTDTAVDVLDATFGPRRTETREGAMRVDTHGSGVRQSQAAIASYITDMLALEKHVQKAIEGQIADLSDESPLVVELRPIVQRCDENVRALEALANERALMGQGLSEAVKKAASTALGFGAAVIDKVRSEKLAKSFRHDFVAISLLKIGYVMLQTTGKALGDEEVADLAERMLASHRDCARALQRVIPLAVLHTLREEGLTIDAGLARSALEVSQDAFDREPRLAGRTPRRTTNGSQAHEAASNTSTTKAAARKTRRPAKSTIVS
jgi:ferritin-like metal-binding protein YciE